MGDYQIEAWEVDKDALEEADILEKISRMDRFNFCEDLPDEIIERILAANYEFKRARFVCRKWRGIVTAPSFFRLHCFQQWGEEIGPSRYDSSEQSSSKANRAVLEQYFVPLVKGDNGKDVVDWKRYYKIRSNYEKFLSLERDNSSLQFLHLENLSSELRKDTLKRVTGTIHMGSIKGQPENSYRALKLLCDLARIHLEQNNLSADYFVVQTWSNNEKEWDKESYHYNTKICRALFELYFIAKNMSCRQLQNSLMQKIVNRFRVSSLDPRILASLMTESIYYDQDLTMKNFSNPCNITKELRSWHANVVLDKRINALYEATEILFNEATEFDEKVLAIELGIKIANATAPEFTLKISKLVAATEKLLENFEEKYLFSLARFVMEFNKTSGYSMLHNMALRNQCILKLTDPHQQFYIACTLLTALDKTRVELFTENDIEVLHSVFLNHNLRTVGSSQERQEQSILMAKSLKNITLFGLYLEPYWTEYDDYFLQANNSDASLAAIYLLDVLGQLHPGQTRDKLTLLMKQRPKWIQHTVFVENYNQMKQIFGNCWTTEHDNAMIELLLDILLDKQNIMWEIMENIKWVGNGGNCPNWIFHNKDEDMVVKYETTSTKEVDAFRLLMKYIESHSSTMSRSVQIQILNIAVSIFNSSAILPEEQKKFVSICCSMPIVQNEDIDDIAAQLLELVAYDGSCNNILLPLVLSYPSAVRVKVSRPRKIADSTVNMAIIGCFYGVRIPVLWKELEDAEKWLRSAKINGESSTEIYNIVIHYAIQLRCAKFDTRTASYCEYSADDHWPLMKEALKEPKVRRFILQFVDDYDPETNFMKNLLPKYDKNQFKYSIKY